MFLKLVCGPGCGDRRRDPDAGHGVSERGGHVGHQRSLLPNLQSVSVQHHPGTLSIPIDLHLSSLEVVYLDLHLSSLEVVHLDLHLSSLQVVHLDLYLSSLEVVHLDLSLL